MHALSMQFSSPLWSGGFRDACMRRALKTAASLPLTGPAVAVWAPNTDVGKSIVCAGLMKCATATSVRANPTITPPRPRGLHVFRAGAHQVLTEHVARPTPTVRPCDAGCRRPVCEACTDRLPCR